MVYQYILSRKKIFFQLDMETIFIIFAIRICQFVNGEVLEITFSRFFLQLL